MSGLSCTKGWCSLSVNQTARDQALELFREEGFTVTVKGDFMLVHDVPYLAAGSTLRRGTLIAKFIAVGDHLQPPENHQVWFQGEFPHCANGQPFTAIGVPNAVGEIGQGVMANFHFSCRPDPYIPYTRHLDLISHYEKLLTHQALALDRTVTARTRRGIHMEKVPTPFRYPDAASIRGDYLSTSERLQLNRVAIIGLGGTGSYVLDQVAKTLVREIHLFDSDTFQVHNAFRAPGAASLEDLERQPAKVDYWAREYGSMHLGVVPHRTHVVDHNLQELLGFDFVFLTIDNGPARKVISTYLRQNNVPFVDCGMDLKLDRENSRAIYGQCRITLSTPNQHDHFDSYAPFMPEGGDGLYESNIQTADMNAINAMLAVIRWKQYFGFYADQQHPHQQVYTPSLHSLTRSVPNPESKA